ncbi:diphthine--ammonia ligase [Stenotrophobium rhamnosiphilum]|uniref:ATP-binding protein n=1 Tax=Stenotrophobium rhamnosiphilum TaxID=2029166 RepID=A0A2T5MFT2_9GAMM|nr:diphthine--ammonia ligase [Stenotrophobium rhamnosiphilum]PTU31434.1 ATP-binding protein [Stenotrophobium rhamnosiphilum]
MSLSKPKAVMAWSGGKDSSLALHRVLSQGDYEVTALLTTLSSEFRRISMHGVREELLEQQAQSLGISLVKMEVLERTNIAYEKELERHLREFKSQGVEAVIFGDIHLVDLRAYRETILDRVGLKGIFPLWQEAPQALLNEFFAEGFRSVTCCVDAQRLGEEHVGRVLDAAFVQSLPADVDVCGENGEYHSYCFDGPIFQRPVAYSLGEKQFRPLVLNPANPGCDLPASSTPGFWYCDLLAA